MNRRSAKDLAGAAFGYLQLRQYGRAKERAKQAIERRPDPGEAWQLLGSIHLETGDYAEADRGLTRAIELRGATTDRAYGDRAVARMELGRRSDALAEAKAAWALKSELGCGLVRDLESRSPE